MGINYRTNSQRDLLYALQGGDSSAVWQYDVALDSWTQIGQVPQPRHGRGPLR